MSAAELTPEERALLEAAGVEMVREAVTTPRWHGGIQVYHPNPGWGDSYPIPATVATVLKWGTDAEIEAIAAAAAAEHLCRQVRRR